MSPNYPEILADLALELACEGQLAAYLRSQSPVSTPEELHEALGYGRAMEHAARRILATVSEHA